MDRVVNSTTARAWRQGSGVVAMAVAVGCGAGARAETIGGALSKAYLNNPDINQQRAAVRVAGRKHPQGERRLSADRLGRGRRRHFEHADLRSRARAIRTHST